MDERRQQNGPPTLIAENIEAIVQAEEQAVGRRSRPEAIMEAIGGWVGTIWFVLVHAGVIAIWALVNSGLFPGLPRIDPYPYGLLSTVVSVEAVLLVAFVLSKQNRMSSLADRRAHLALQVNLLTERETSKALQLLQKLCEQQGIQEGARDREARELAQPTQVEHFVDELSKRLPSD